MLQNFVCLCQQLASKGILFLGGPCVRDHVLKVCERDTLESISQRFFKWPKWYATARTTTGNKTVGTEMS